MSPCFERSFRLTAELQRAYSRGGNFHADDDAARALGLPGLVAQGMQVASPAYGILLDRWGDQLLARSEIELTFVSMVTAGETVDAVVNAGEHAAELTVTARGSARPAVVGSARLRRT